MTTGENTELGFFDEPDSNLLDVLNALVVQKELVAEMKAGLEDEVKHMEELQEQAFEMMTQAGVQNVQLGNKKLYLMPRRYLSVKAANREQAFEWLRENGYSHLLKEKIDCHAGTLTAELKPWLEDGGTLPDDLFNDSVKNIIGVRTLKKG